MPREFKAYLSDILQAITKIEKYTDKLSFDDFLKDELKQDGIIRNPEIIGEAVKKIPDSFKIKTNQIESRKIAGLRDILIHACFGIDLELIWDIIQTKIPEVKSMPDLIDGVNI
jgi:uncharacterized protein with HEPN domain